MYVPVDAVSALGRQLPARWALSLFPDAGEAGGSFVPVPRRGGGQRGIRGAAADPERSIREAGFRARARLRRYCAANSLDHMGTLTYAGEGCHEPEAVRADLAGFFRRLRSDLGGRPLPYVWVPEWHPGGHGLHAHFAVGRYVRKGLVAEAWGRGFVKITGRPKDMPVGTSAREAARRVAGYLAKYLSKTLGQSANGLHRYEVAQGFQPRGVLLTGRSVEDVLEQACGVMGSSPVTRWSSTEALDWQGPPAVSFRWA